MNDHIDPARTGLVLIDLQQGIVEGPATPHSAESVVASAERLADKFRSAGALIVHVHVAFKDRRDRLNPAVDSPTPVVSMPADFSKLVLEVSDADLVITKRQWGAFYGTELDLQLRRRGIDTIVLAGIATSFGVESTARTAFELGYNQFFVEDACTNRNAEAHQISFEVIFPRIGKVRSTDQVLAAL
jgi:nicotinamidase-related amidase